MTKFKICSLVIMCVIMTVAQCYAGSSLEAALFRALITTAIALAMIAVPVLLIRQEAHRDENNKLKEEAIRHYYTQPLPIADEAEIFRWLALPCNRCKVERFKGREMDVMYDIEFRNWYRQQQLGNFDTWIRKKYKELKMVHS